MVKFIIGKPYHLVEHSSSQVASRGSSHSRCHKTYQNACRHSKKCQPGHFSPCSQQVMYLEIIHIYSEIFIYRSDITDCRLIQNRIRHISHLFFHGVHHSFSLFFRHHLHYIKYCHLFLRCSFRKGCFHLFFDLCSHIAARFKAGSHHHRISKNLLQTADIFL